MVPPLLCPPQNFSAQNTCHVGGDRYHHLPPAGPQRNRKDARVFIARGRRSSESVLEQAPRLMLVETHPHVTGHSSLPPPSPRARNLHPATIKRNNGGLGSRHPQRTQFTRGKLQRGPVPAKETERIDAQT